MSNFRDNGTVALKNDHKHYLSWTTDGDCRADQNEINTEEKWTMMINDATNTCKFGKPLGNGLYSWMSTTLDKHVNCKASWEDATEWQIEKHGAKCAFKAVGGDYLSNDFPFSAKDRQVLADRTRVGAWELFDIISLI